MSMYSKMEKFFKEVEKFFPSHNIIMKGAKSEDHTYSF
jgi:hypothetical protein